mmetsp:Transcript_88677/g.237131  ORF Transcript_88677/g.237131 Transcript_88677/m.237131 type:complete len:297 (+) Transcript_88677:674-1564(+)
MLPDPSVTSKDNCLPRMRWKADKSSRPRFQSAMEVCPNSANATCFGVIPSANMFRTYTPSWSRSTSMCCTASSSKSWLLKFCCIAISGRSWTFFPYGVSITAQMRLIPNTPMTDTKHSPLATRHDTTCSIITNAMTKHHTSNRKWTSCTYGNGIGTCTKRSALAYASKPSDNPLNVLVKIGGGTCFNIPPGFCSNSMNFCIHCTMSCGLCFTIFKLGSKVRSNPEMTGTCVLGNTRSWATHMPCNREKSRTTFWLKRSSSNSLLSAPLENAISCAAESTNHIRIDVKDVTLSQYLR